MQQRRIRKHHAFDFGVIARCAAFDQVRRQREGRARKTNQRRFVAQTLAQQPDHVHHEAGLFHRIGDDQFFHLFGGANRRFDYRAAGFDDIQFDAHRFDRDQDVRKHNDRIHTQNVIGLHGNFGGQFRRFAQRQKIRLAANGAIFRQVAPGLAHHPDRRAVNRLPTAGANQSIVVNHQDFRFSQKSDCKIGLRATRPPGFIA